MDQLADSVYVETRYRGCNVAAIKTKRGIVCIDAPSYPSDARDWIARLRRLDSRPVRYVILMDAHGDRIIHTRWIGAPIIAHTHCAERLTAYERRYPQALLASLMARDTVVGRQLAQPAIDQATLIFTCNMALSACDSPIRLSHVAGSSEGGIQVHLPGHDILFTGDLLVTCGPPVLTYCQPEAWLQLLENVRRMAAHGTAVVPGHGPMATEADVQAFADFLRQVIQIVNSLIDRDYTRVELNAAANELIGDFSAGDLPRAWVKAQLKAGLESIVDDHRQRLHSSRIAAA